MLHFYNIRHFSISGAENEGSNPNRRRGDSDPALDEFHDQRDGIHCQQTYIRASDKRIERGGYTGHCNGCRLQEGEDIEAFRGRG